MVRMIPSRMARWTVDFSFGYAPVTVSPLYFSSYQYTLVLLRSRTGPALLSCLFVNLFERS
jgi:hypothetical protein